MLIMDPRYNQFIGIMKIINFMTILRQERQDDREDLWEMALCELNLLMQSDWHRRTCFENCQQQNLLQGNTGRAFWDLLRQRDSSIAAIQEDVEAVGSPKSQQSRPPVLASTAMLPGWGSAHWTRQMSNLCNPGQFIHTSQSAGFVTECAQLLNHFMTFK